MMRLDASLLVVTGLYELEVSVLNVRLEFGAVLTSFCIMLGPTHTLAQENATEQMARYVLQQLSEANDGIVMKGIGIEVTADRDPNGNAIRLLKVGVDVDKTTSPQSFTLKTEIRRIDASNGQYQTVGNFTHRGTLRRIGGKLGVYFKEVVYAPQGKLRPRKTGHQSRQWNTREIYPDVFLSETACGTEQLAVYLVSTRAGNGGFELDFTPVLSGTPDIRSQDDCAARSLANREPTPTVRNGKLRIVERPTGKSSYGSSTQNGAWISSATHTIEHMRASFSACYNRALRRNPDLVGSVSIVANIGADGQVSSATSKERGLTAEVVGVFQRR